jgi:hypothetical protein
MHLGSGRSAQMTFVTSLTEEIRFIFGAVGEQYSCDIADMIVSPRIYEYFRS